MRVTRPPRLKLLRLLHLDCAVPLWVLMLRPKDLKKSQHVARCALMVEERKAFTKLVDTIVDLVPLRPSPSSTASYLRKGIVQREGELRLLRLVASTFRIVSLHFPDVSVDVGSKSGIHACYAIGTGSIPTRSGVGVLKASVIRYQHSGSSWVWFLGWAPAIHVVQSAVVGGPPVTNTVFWHLHRDARVSI